MCQAAVVNNGTLKGKFQQAHANVRHFSRGHLRRQYCSALYLVLIYVQDETTMDLLLVRPEARPVGGSQEACAGTHEPLGYLELLVEGAEIEVPKESFIESPAVAVLLWALRVLPAGLHPVVL